MLLCLKVNPLVHLSRKSLKKIRRESRMEEKPHALSALAVLSQTGLCGSEPSVIDPAILDGSRQWWWWGEDGGCHRQARHLVQDGAVAPSCLSRVYVYVLPSSCQCLHAKESKESEEMGMFMTWRV